FGEAAKLVERYAQRGTSAPVLRVSSGQHRQWPQRFLRIVRGDLREAIGHHQRVVAGKSVQRLGGDGSGAIAAAAFAQGFRKLLRGFEVVWEGVVLAG